MSLGTVHVAIYEGLADWEVGHTIAHLRSGEWRTDGQSYEVVTVGATTEPVTSMGGMRIVPDVSIGNTDAAHSAMLILPGADTWMTGDNSAFITLAQLWLTASVPVAAICGATIGLAAAGMLDSRPHTSDAKEVLAQVGYGGAEHYVDQLAVTDGDLITAAGVAPVAFARAVFERLDYYPAQVLEAWVSLYGTQDPAAFFQLWELTGGE